MADIKGHTNHQPSMPPQSPSQPPTPVKPVLPSRSLGTHPRCLTQAKQREDSSCGQEQNQTLKITEASPLQRSVTET